MYGTDPRERAALGVARRGRKARQKRYALRRITAVALILGLMVGLYYGTAWLVEQISSFYGPAVEATGPLQTVAATEPLPFQPEHLLAAGDLNGDGQPEQIAVSAADGAMRQIALVSGTGRRMRMVAQPTRVADFPLQMKDLARAPSVLVQVGRLPSQGPHQEVQVGGQKALLAMGGEPDFKAWRLDGTKGLLPADYYELAAPLTPSKPDLLLVDKYLNVLWHYQGGQLAGTYRVTTGAHLQGPYPTAGNQATNFLTPLGEFSVAAKEANLPYFRENIPGGDPRNPLGTRWIGFKVYEGDRAMVWGIHGTNEPDKIGLWVSNGCIRMTNAEIEALYEQVSVGTPLEIISSGL